MLVSPCTGIVWRRGLTGKDPEDYLGNSYLKRGLREGDLRK